MRPNSPLQKCGTCIDSLFRLLSRCVSGRMCFVFSPDSSDLLPFSLACFLVMLDVPLVSFFVCSRLGCSLLFCFCFSHLFFATFFFCARVIACVHRAPSLSENYCCLASSLRSLMARGTHNVRWQNTLGKQNHALCEKRSMSFFILSLELAVCTPRWTAAGITESNHVLLLCIVLFFRVLANSCTVLLHKGEEEICKKKQKKRRSSAYCGEVRLAQCSSIELFFVVFFSPFAVRVK